MSKGHTIVKLIKKFILRKKKVFFGLGGDLGPYVPPTPGRSIFCGRRWRLYFHNLSHFFQVHAAFNIQSLFYLFIWETNKLLHTHTHTLNYTLTKCPQHEFVALRENYAPQWKILHNGLMVNKSPNKKTKVVNKSNFWWFWYWWKISTWLHERQSLIESNTTSYHLCVVSIDLCSLGFWLKVYVITKSIMSLRAQAHDILLNHDFHSEKYCIMD